jgi:hypothetical protein
MKILRRSLILMGLSALLGFSATGCQNGQLQPGPLLTAMAERRANRAELSHPRAIPEGIAYAPVRPAPISESPIIRTAAVEEEIPGAAVASSWRPVSHNRGSESRIVSLGSPLEARPQPIRTVSSREVSLQPEPLHQPRAVNPPVRSQVVMSHSAHGVHIHDLVHHAGVFPDPDVPHEGMKAPLPPYVIEPPDLLEIQFTRRGELVPQPILGQFLVHPDGTVHVGIYGSVLVAGLTIEEARREIARLIEKRVKPKKGEDGKEIPLEEEVSVDVLDFASKYCYLVVNGAGFGEAVIRIAINGSDTVLDVVGKIGGLPPQSSLKKMWLARANHGHNFVLPIDWCGITQRGEVVTNYQIFPRDRIYVKPDNLIAFNNWLNKFKSPVDGTFGSILLGGTMVHVLQNVAPR